MGIDVEKVYEIIVPDDDQVNASICPGVSTTMNFLEIGRFSTSCISVFN